MTKRRRVRRVGQVAVSLAAVWALFAAGGTQAATVTVGSPLAGSFTGTFGGPVTDLNVALPEPGAQVASPVTGTVVRWRAIVGHTGDLALRVIKPGNGGAYLGVSSSPATATATGTQTFSANLPINAGELIGLDISDVNATVKEASNTVPGAAIKEWNPPLANGAALMPNNTYPNSELGYNADVRYCLVPSLKGKRPGTAKQTLSDAGCAPGKVTKPKRKKGKLTVKSQSIPPGTSLADGSTVDLKLGKSKKKTKK